MTGKQRTRSKRRGKAKSLPSRFQPQFWSDLDGRLNLTRAIKENYQTLCEQTGVDTYAKELLAQRAIFVALQIETMETQAASNGEFNQAQYVSLVNTLQGLLGKLGLDDVSEENAIDLEDYIVSKSKGRK